MYGLAQRLHGAVEGGASHRRAGRSFALGRLWHVGTFPLVDVLLRPRRYCPRNGHVSNACCYLLNRVKLFPMLLQLQNILHPNPHKSAALSPWPQAASPTGTRSNDRTVVFFEESMLAERLADLCASGHV